MKNDALFSSTYRLNIFTENMVENIGKNISENLSGKYSQKLLDYAN